MRSRSLTILACLGVFVFFVGLGVALSLPPPVPVIPTVAIILGLWFNHRNIRRREGAAAQDPVALATYAVTIPAQRVALGRGLQLKRVQEARKVYAQGVLCAAPGRLGFIPSRQKDATKRWEGAVDSVSFPRAVGGTTVLAHSPHGPAQFEIRLPHAKVEAALAPYVRVEGSDRSPDNHSGETAPR